MWAEITLDLINEEAVKEYDRKVKEGKIQVRDRHAVFPLSVLAQRMRKGPLYISYLMSAFRGNVSMEDFIGLVRQLLPDKEIEIMAETIDRRITKFCEIFSKRYFPLDDSYYYDEEDLDGFVRSMPIHIQGCSEEDYHNFADTRPGYILMLSLIHAPYEFDEEEIKACSRGLMRTSDKIPILDKTGSLIHDIDLLKKLPKHGWTNGELRQMVKDTPLWWGLADYADWICNDTEWDIMNLTSDEAIITIPWDIDTVKSMTIEWPKIVAFWTRIDDMANWLEKDLTGNYRELVEELLKWHYYPPRSKRLVKSKTLVEVLGNEQEESSCSDTANRSELVEVA